MYLGNAKGRGMESFTYAIVGASSAARVLGNRLTASGDSKVLPLEAGGSDKAPAIHVPAAVQSMFGIRAVARSTRRLRLGIRGYPSLFRAFPGQFAAGRCLYGAKGLLRVRDLLWMHEL
jgi:choline dehydrogenase-like flavoprotein